MKLAEITNHDTPLLVSMLQKLIRSHFKHQGPMVKLQDDEYGVQRAYITGTQWQSGALTVYANTPVGTLREIVYPWEQTKDHLTLKRDRDQDEWVLTYDPRAS
jgi:hypothetical protein